MVGTLPRCFSGIFRPQKPNTYRRGISNLIYNWSMIRKDIIKKFQAHGWVLDRINGSHHILSKDGKAVPVPVHGTKDVGAGLLASIARQTGVKIK